MPIYKKKNEDFFKKWSMDMAYVLGFFAADGSMYKTKRDTHYVEFESVDQEVIEKIRSVIAPGVTVSERIRNQIHKKVWRLQIGSKLMFFDLLKRGMMPTKSLVLPFPRIPTKYVPHFVRGYFDGDGSISVGKYKTKTTHSFTLMRFTSGSKPFLMGLRKAIQSSAGAGSLFRGSRAWQLSYGLHASKKIALFLYPPPTTHLIYLSRKYRIIQSIC